MKWMEFFIWCEEFLMRWLRSPTRCLECWYVGETLLLTMGLSGTPSLRILGSPYSFGSLQLARRSCFHTSSVIVDFYAVVCFFVLSAQWDPWSATYRTDPQEGRLSSGCSQQCWESHRHCLCLPVGWQGRCFSLKPTMPSSWLWLRCILVWRSS